MQAQELSLKKIINYVRVHHPHYKALEEESIALEAKAKAEYARSQSSLSLSAAQAKPDGADSGREYSASVMMPLDIAGTRGLEMESADLVTEATLLKKQIALFAFGNRVRNLYHQSCLDRERVRLFEESLRAFDKLLYKKRIAYKYHEVSKKELLQIEMEHNLLKERVVSMHSQYETSRSALLNLTNMPKDSDSSLECKDLYPIKAKIKIENEPFLLSNLSYQKEIEALAVKYRRYSRFSDPVGLSVGYDDEIDTKRYGVGVEIPLSFTSERNQQQRLYLLHDKKVKKSHHMAWLLEANAKKEQLYARLRNDYRKIKALDENMHRYENELMPLIEKSFQMGESSLIEYLMGRSKLLEISVELIESKQNYYQSLFDLYTLIETER